MSFPSDSSIGGRRNIFDVASASVPPAAAPASENGGGSIFDTSQAAVAEPGRPGQDPRPRRPRALGLSGRRPAAFVVSGLALTVVATLAVAFASRGEPEPAAGLRERPAALPARDGAVGPAGRPERPQLARPRHRRVATRRRHSGGRDHRRGRRRGLRPSITESGHPNPQAAPATPTPPEPTAPAPARAPDGPAPAPVPDAAPPEFL